MNPATSRMLPQPRLGIPPRSRPPEATRSALSNGVRLVTVPRGTLPQVGIRLVVPVGALRPFTSHVISHSSPWSPTVGPGTSMLRTVGHC